MILLAVALSAASSPTPNLSWLEGEWCTLLEKGRQTCEHWGPDRGGTMLGYSQTTLEGVTKQFEYMRIVVGLPDGNGEVVRLAFVALPNGARPTVFGWSPDAQPGVTFFNTANDYPRRIRYWREGAQLHAEISLADGSKPMRWIYHRVR